MQVFSRNIFVPVFSTAFFLLGASSALAASFSDVPSTHANYQAIETLSGAGVIKGYDDGLFKADNAVNRVEALKMILKSANVTVSDTSGNFSDVAESEWFAGFVYTAQKNGIVSGDGKTGKFMPARSVVKAEFLKMALISFNHSVVKHSARTGVAADVPNGSWFAPYMSYARALLIVSADRNNNMFPQKELTRGECAQIIFELIILKQNGDVQKYLRLTESELLNTISSIANDNHSLARTHADSAVFYGGLALKEKPEEGIVKAANEIALAMQDLVSSYEAGLNQDREKVIAFANAAKEKAGIAYTYSPSTQPIGKKIKKYADELLLQVSQ